MMEHRNYNMQLKDFAISPASWSLAVLAACFPIDVSAATPEQVRAAIRQAGSAERFIDAMASRTAKMAPRMIDAVTELTGAAADGRTLVYFIRLVEHSRSDVGDIGAARQKAFNLNAAAVCSAPVASILINEHAAEYKYIVYSKSKEYLFEYAFNRKSCPANASR